MRAHAAFKSFETILSGLCTVSPAGLKRIILELKLWCLWIKILHRGNFSKSQYWTQKSHIQSVGSIRCTLHINKGMWIHQIIKRRRKRKRKRRIKHYTSITGTAGIQKICLTAYWNMPMMKPMSIASGIVRRPVVSCGLINRFFVLWCPCLLLYSPPLAMELPLHFSLLHSKALSNKADGNDLPWRFRDIGVWTFEFFKPVSLEPEPG